MSKIFVVTDSTCDLPVDIETNEFLRIIPMTINYNGKTYRDRLDLKTSDMVEILNQNPEELPKTSQVTPLAFYETYAELLKEDCDIISIHISSALSGTCQSALIAKNMLNEERIHIIDSKSVSLGTGLLVVQALNLIKNGNNAESIAQEIIELADRVRVAFAVDSLEYLRKGGRLSGTQATIGTLLNIKPIIYSNSGKLEVLDKARGFKKAQARLIQYVIDEGVDPEYGLCAGSLLTKEEMNGFLEQLMEKSAQEIKMLSEVGSVVSIYSGPKVVGVYFIKERS